MSTNVGTASIELNASTQQAKQVISAFASTMKQQLLKLTQPIKLAVRFNETDLDAQFKKVSGRIKDASQELRQVLELDVSALKSVLALLGKQISDLKSIEQSLKSMGLPRSGGTGAGGGGPPNNAYLGQLQAWRTELKAGTADAATFKRGLETLQASLQTDIAALRQLGTLSATEARQMQQMKAALAGVNQEINKNSLTALRSDLAQARAAFEQATGAAGRFNFVGQRQATQAYEDQLRRLTQQIRAVAQQSGLTQADLRGLNQLSAQIGSQRNALNGVFTQVGLVGNIQNALKSLPQFAAQMGGSLGAAFAGAQQLTGGLGGMAAAAGPAGLAIGAVTVALAGLVAGLSKAISTASGFQQTMVDIRALTQPTAADFRALTQATFDIGKSLGVGARQAAAAVLELNKAGLSAKDVIGGGLKGALELAGAAGITTAEAAQQAVSAMTAFGLRAGDLSKIADVYANFANKTTLSSSDLQQAIAAVGPVARDAGIGLEQFAGLMATLAQGGFKNMSDAGTSLKTMLLQLQAPTGDAAKYLGAIKTQVYDAAGRMRPLNSILADMRAKFAQLTPEAQNYIKKGIAGTDAIRALGVFLREGPKAINANTDAMRKQGEASRVARERMDSLQGAGKKFSAVMEQLRIQIGTPFLKPLQGIVEWATRGAQALVDMGEKGRTGFGSLAGLARSAEQGLAPIQQMLGALGQAVQTVWDNILKPILISLWQIWTVVQTAAQTALGIVLRVVQGVFVAVGGIVQGFVQSFTGQGKSVNLTLAGMAAKVTEWATIARTYILAVGKVAATLVPVFHGVGVGVGQILAGIVRALGGLATGAKGVFVAAAGYAMGFVRALGNFGSGAGQIIRGVGQILGGFALAVRNAFVERVQAVFTAGARLFSVFGDGIGKLLKPAQNAFFTYIVQPAQTMGNFLYAAFQRAAGIVGDAVGVVGRVLSPLGRVLSALGISVGGALESAASTARSAIAGILDRFSGQANAAYQQAARAAQQQATATATGTAGIVESALNSAGKALQDFAADNGAGAQVSQGLKTLNTGLQTVTSTSQQLRQDVSSTSATLAKDVGGAATQITSAGKDMAAGVKTVQTAVSGVGAQVKTVMNGVQNDLKAGAKTAADTAKTVQQAAAVKPPATSPPGGTGGLDSLGLDKTAKAANTTGIALTKFKDALRAKSAQQLKDLLIQRQAANDSTAYNAVKAEMARREKAHAASLKITGVELVKFREALRGKTDQQLKDLLGQERVKATTAAYSAVLAEQTRRQNVLEAAQKRAAAAAQALADRRATLVREMRQALSVFDLQVRQNKVTEASLLSFQNRVQDFRANFSKLPASLQKGTQALFDQASALATTATAHMKASGVIKLAGAALDEYKKKLAGVSDIDSLRSMLDVEKQTGNVQKQSLILAEIERRTKAKAEADRKAALEAQRHSEAAANLERETRQLNERFQTQITAGKVTTESLQSYSQALEDAGARLEKLPPAYREATQALIANGASLKQQGQAVIDQRAEVDKLRESVVNWSLAELEAARARLSTSDGPQDKEKLKILDAQIARVKKLTDAQAEQAHAESLLSQAGSNREGIEGEYAARQAAARGNLTALYQLELDFGERLRSARNAEADAQATADAEAVRKKYSDLLALQGISDDRRIQLEQDRDRELAAIETRRTNAHAANLASRNQAEEDAKRDLDGAIVTLDRQTRDTIRKNNLDALARRTADVERQQAEELAADELTEQQKLDILRKYEPLLRDAKQKEVQASREIELQAEADRFQDAVDEAQRKFGVTQAFLDAKTKLEEENRSNVAAINSRWDSEESNYRLKLTQDVGKQRLASEKATAQELQQEAKDSTGKLLENLDEQTTAQRNAARATLLAWRTTYSAMGDAGKKAVAEIDDALKQLDTQDKKVRAGAAKLISDPTQVGSSVAGKLARIATPESADAASEAAVARYDELLTDLQTKLSRADDALASFKTNAGETLTPDQEKTRQGLAATVEAYQRAIEQVRAAATKAGQDAGAAFTRAQADEAAESALALAEIQYEIAQQEGRDGGPAYLAGLRAALAYWRGRLTGMTLGTDEYTSTLKKINELEKKVTSANPVTNLGSNLTKAAEIVGKNSPIQAAIAAGLEGLAAFFDKGGTKGGSKAILAGAAALVGGLADVFKTGEPEIDQVVNTFVSGLQGTIMKLATGDYIGAAIAAVATVVSTIIDIIQGGKASAQKAAKEISEATKDVRFFDLSKYAKVVSRGGFWGWLGFKKSEIDQEAVDIAKSLGDAIYSAISTAMMDGIKAGKTSFSELGIDLKKALGENILQGLIDGFMKGAVMQGVLQPFLDSYIEAMRASNAQGLAKAASDLQNAAVGANTKLQTFYQDVLVPISQQLGLFGTDVPSETSPRSGQASIDLGIPSAPTGVVAAPAWALDMTAAIVKFTPALEAVTPLLERLVGDGIAVNAQAEVVVQAPQSDLRAYAR